MMQRERLLPSVVEAIGETPLVELSRLTRGRPGRIMAKLEYLNPGFSKKDRIAREIIEEAAADGRLSAGQPVVELTSGNTGTGLAIVCAVRGHPFVAVMSRGNSAERARMMRALGAEVVLVDQAPGAIPGQVSGDDLALVEKETARLVQERGAFRADQFRLEDNFRAHYRHTGPEILMQTGAVPSARRTTSGGRRRPGAKASGGGSQVGRPIDAFCDFAGTGGSFAGCAAAFKEHDPAIRCFLVEPAGAQVLAGLPVSEPRHRIQGGGYAMANLPLVRPEHVDGYLAVTDEEAVRTTRRLAREEGIFAGFSSGANVAAALSLLEGELPGASIVVLLNDSGLKYLSTDLWK